ncbi:MAG: FlgD immunoglobulin-like domain containing protein [Candidatus Neomarinimicrobiota bacterium]
MFNRVKYQSVLSFSKIILILLILKTIIRFNVNNSENVNISVYTINGMLIKELLNSYINPGNHSVKWNGMDKNNKRVSSGVYLYKMVSGDNVSSLKMILAK